MISSLVLASLLKLRNFMSCWLVKIGLSDSGVPLKDKLTKWLTLNGFLFFINTIGLSLDQGCESPPLC